ncbi:MAG: hypothetical protein LBN20_06575 [Endomicrobium sp.]|jgi:predicted transcriptional regulator of viral defense system|nr:hypothetical protein [Endomicrobium sp.]
MEKNYLTFEGLSKQEMNLVVRLSYYNKYTVSYDEIKKYLPQDNKYIAQLIYRLKKKKILTPIKRGFYTFNPVNTLAGGRQVNDFNVGNIFFPNKNYYIGYYNMFNAYGLTEQIPQMTFIANTSLSAVKTISGLQFKFIKVKEECLYGLTTNKYNGEEVIVSDKERTMVDFVDYWNIKEAQDKIIEIIKNDECDIKKFIGYAEKFPKIKVRKFIGVILEKAGIADEMTKDLCDSVKDSAVISMSKNSRVGETNKKWGVIIDDTRK